MSRNKEDQPQADQGFLNEELESLYRKVAEERLADAASFKDVPLDEREPGSEPENSGKSVPGSKTRRGPGSANAVAKFFLFFIPALLIFSFAFFIWPTPYDFSPVKQGGRSYLVKTNRFTDSKTYFYNGQWLSAPPSDISSLRMPDPLSIKSVGDAPLQIEPPAVEDKKEGLKKEETKSAAPAPLQTVPAAKPLDPASLAATPKQELPVKETLAKKEQKQELKSDVKPQPKTTPKPKPEVKPQASAQAESVSRLGVAVPPPAPGKTKIGKKAISKRKPYTIQIGAFRSEDDLNVFMQEHRRRADMHWAKVQVKDQIWYRAFIGRFADQAEAKRYIKQRKIEKTYPGCFVQKAG